MRNYWPNQGAEDTTRVQWAGSSLFGYSIPASSEYSSDQVRTGNFATKVIWPDVTGSGKMAAIAEDFQHEGIGGKWRVGCWLYVPSGEPDVIWGVAYGAERFTVTEKDQWVQAELIATVDPESAPYLTLALFSDIDAPAGVAYMDDIYAYPGETGADSSEPEIQVDISWTGLPLKKAQTWEDITEYVQGFNPKHGRPNEIGSAEAGTCSLILDNGDGRFTPNRQASPYSPNVRSRRPVRIRAFWDGAEWPIFYGHVDRWPVETVTDSTNVTVELVDTFGILAKKRLENPYINMLRTLALREAYILNDGPDTFAPLLNPQGPRAKPFIPKGSVLAESEADSTPTLAANTESIMPNGAGLGVLRVSGTTFVEGQPDGHGLTGRGVEFPPQVFDTTATSAGWSISFVHSFEGLPEMGPGTIEDVGTALALRLEDSFGNLFLEVKFTANWWTKGYTLYWPDSVLGIDSHSWGLADAYTTYKGGGNRVTISFSNDSRLDGSNIPGLGVWVNGWGGYKEIPGSSFLGLVTECRMLAGSHDSLQAGEDSILAHDYRLGAFSIHDMPIDGWDISLLGYRAAGNPAQKPGDRLSYFLEQLGYDQSVYIDTASDESRLRFLNWEDKANALDELRLPALHTNGLLFVNPAGYVTFHSRRFRQNPVPHLIFDHDEGTGVETPIQFDMSEQDIVNVVDVDNAYGVKTQIRNEASVDIYDEVSQEKAVRLEDDDDAIQFGYWIVNRFSESQLRIDSVSVNPSAHSDGGLWGHVLSGGVSTVIGLRGLPETGPDADGDYFIESVEHEVERSGDRLLWRTTYQVSPATDHEAWLLGDDTYGVLGTSTRLHY